MLLIQIKQNLKPLQFLPQKKDQIIKKQISLILNTPLPSY